MVNYTYCNTAFAIMRDLAVNSLLSISLGMKKIPLEVSPGIHFCVKEPKVGLGKLKSYFLFQVHNTPAVRPWAAWPSRRRLVPEVSFLYHKT